MNGNNHFHRNFYSYYYRYYYIDGYILLYRCNYTDLFNGVLRISILDAISVNKITKIINGDYYMG